MSTCKESTEDGRRRFLRAAYYFIGWGVFSLLAGCQSTSSGGALRQAAAAGDTTKVERILARSPGDVNDSDSRSGMTPLEFAVITGDEATVKSLLAHGADVNVYDKLGMNAIAHAIRKDNWTIVQLLLNHNAHLKDVRLLGKGVTPLMVRGK
ncbi:MAG TPA: ankyrin repeat domain-containing protein [Phycisphaerae bacterium]|nr:ankyrin repeat domain-containing protein [Phycisphaerae bacterium]